MAVSLSTAWNAFRHTDGYQMLFEIKELGFQEVELSFNITSKMLVGIRQAVKEGIIKVVSIHNTCPTPEGVPRELALPDYFSISSLDQGKRAAAIKYAKQSIDTAVILGARALVLHCGRLEVPDRTRTLIELFNQGQASSDEFRSIRDDMLLERRDRATTFFDNTLKSLGEIVTYAGSKNIALGIENRFYFREIPSFEETGIILKEFAGSTVGYWHDTGHAQILSILGLAPKQEDCLQHYHQSLTGFHLHDVIGCQDHLAPSKGNLSFSFIKEYSTTETLKVIEAHHPATASDVKTSKEFITSLLDEPS